jgi:hypothetical protein
LHVSTERRGFLLVCSSAEESFDYLLTHELAHWYSESVDVELPIVVEEGLADAIAMRVVPRLIQPILQARERTSGNGSWTLEQALKLRFDSWVPLDVIEEQEVRSLGFLLVQNLGLADLAKLRAEARARGLDHVPAEWFLGEGPGAAYPRLR